LVAQRIFDIILRYLGREKPVKPISIRRVTAPAYSSACVGGLEYSAAGHLAVHQVLLAKPDDEGRVDLPPSRAWLYT